MQGSPCCLAAPPAQGRRKELFFWHRMSIALFTRALNGANDARSFAPHPCVIISIISISLIIPATAATETCLQNEIIL